MGHYPGDDLRERLLALPRVHPIHEFDSASHRAAFTRGAELAGEPRHALHPLPRPHPIHVGRVGVVPDAGGGDS